MRLEVLELSRLYTRYMVVNYQICSEKSCA